MILGAGSRFRYTGQMALPEAQLYHYRARAYDPLKGRFLQTDPIGYGDGMNIYAYVHGDWSEPPDRDTEIGDSSRTKESGCLRRSDEGLAASSSWR